MEDFLGLLLFGAIPGAAVQFVCCFFRPVIAKFTPFGILVILWVAALQTTGFDSLRFTMTLFTVPILIGMAAGWLLYALFLAVRDAIKKGRKKTNENE